MIYFHGSDVEIDSSFRVTSSKFQIRLLVESGFNLYTIDLNSTHITKIQKSYTLQKSKNLFLVFYFLIKQPLIEVSDFSFWSVRCCKVVHLFCLQNTRSRVFSTLSVLRGSSPSLNRTVEVKKEEKGKYVRCGIDCEGKERIYIYQEGKDGGMSRSALRRIDLTRRTV